MDLPAHLITMGTHSMLAMLEVKGETTEASACDSEMPTSAAFRAPQSLAPSPHMPTQYLAHGMGQIWAHMWMLDRRVPPVSPRDIAPSTLEAC